MKRLINEDVIPSLGFIMACTWLDQKQLFTVPNRNALNIKNGLYYSISRTMMLISQMFAGVCPLKHRVSRINTAWSFEG